MLSAIRPESRVRVSSTSCLLGAGDACVEQAWVLGSGNSQSRGTDSSRTITPAVLKWPLSRKIGPWRFLGIPPRAPWNFLQERQRKRKRGGRAFESWVLTYCMRQMFPLPSLCCLLSSSHRAEEDTKWETPVCTKSLRCLG